MFKYFFDFYFKKIILYLIIFLFFTRNFCIDVNSLFILNNSLQSLSKISKEKSELKLVLKSSEQFERTYQYGSIFLKLIIDDILSIPADAIVNAANQQCLGGGGIDGYITKHGGDSLRDARKRLPIVIGPDIRCPILQARITRAGDLTYSVIKCEVKEGAFEEKNQFKYVLHAVGPTCDPTTVTDENKKDLVTTYVNTLKRADAFNKNPKDKNYKEFELVDIEDLKPNYKITSITFPAISTGIFGCNTKDTAASVVKGVLDYLKDNQNTDIKLINFAFYDPLNFKKAKDDFDHYKQALDSFL